MEYKGHVMTQESDNSIIKLGLRGILRKCPKCGHGKLYQAYLKPVEESNLCGETLGQIRADDAPTWLTMFVVLHLLAPILLIAARCEDISYPLLIAGISLLAVALCFLILPCAKGLFIAILWRSQAGTGRVIRKD